MIRTLGRVNFRKDLWNLISGPIAHRRVPNNDPISPCESYPRTHAHRHTPTVWYKEDRWNPSPEFLIRCCIRNDFALSEKPLIFSTKRGIFYGEGPCWKLVTSPTWSPFSILSGIRNQVKTVKINIFCG